jgi:hypothetical protein
MLVGLGLLGSALTLQAEPAKEPPWPRLEIIQGNSKLFYDLKADAWEGEAIVAHCTVVFQAYGQAQADVGTVYFRARTLTNSATRLVHLLDMEILRVSFPSAPAQEQTYKAHLRGALPRQLEYVALHRLESEQVKQEARGEK